MKKNDTVDILGVSVDRITMAQAVEQVCSFFEGEQKAAIYTPNSEIIMNAYKDEAFRQVLNKADLLLPDGIGVVKAAGILKKPLAERVAGFDLLKAVFGKIKDKPVKVFLLGSKPGVADEAKRKLEETYPGLQIVGTQDGYFQEDGPVIEKINAAAPDFLLVCLGAPKQEYWIDKNLPQLQVKAAIGAGGSLDVFAGTVKRAPEFYIRHNLEWLYRLLCQPSRFIRMLSLPKFALTVIFKGRRQG